MSIQDLVEKCLIRFLEIPFWSLSPRFDSILKLFSRVNIVCPLMARPSLWLIYNKADTKHYLIRATCSYSISMWNMRFSIALLLYLCSEIQSLIHSVSTFVRVVTRFVARWWQFFLWCLASFLAHIICLKGLVYWDLREWTSYFDKCHRVKTKYRYSHLDLDGIPICRPHQHGYTITLISSYKGKKNHHCSETSSKQLKTFKTSILLIR